MTERTALSPRLIIVTDLDGTLLHPRTYSFEEARPALELIRQKQIPLVLCSSKTRAEIEVYRKRLDNAIPLFPRTAGGYIFQWDISRSINPVTGGTGMS